MEKSVDFKKEFAELLSESCLYNNASIEESQEVWGKIKALLLPNIPSKLFRFRSCNVNNIISLQKGTISFCVAGKFNDKYDSLVYINREAINKTVEDFLDKGGVDVICRMFTDASQHDNLVSDWGEDVVKIISTFLNTTPIEECRKKMFDDIRNFKEVVLSRINNHVDFMRKGRNTKIACFTEDVQSLYMWDQYAEGYKGFALEYDFREFYSKGCRMCPNNPTCLHESKNYSNLFPVIYSNERYDATTNIVNFVLKDFFQELNAHVNYPFDLLYLFKSYLYKNIESYAHEKEWRIITCCPHLLDSDYAEISDMGCLKAIYYGPNMEKQLKDFLSIVAKTRGLQEYDLTIDDQCSRYALKVVPYNEKKTQ